MLISDFKQFGGKNHETAALKNVLAHLGIVAPHTGQPFSEEFLFGLGGGLGLTYFVFEFSGVPSMYIGTRYHLELLPAICERLGASPTVLQTAGARAAEKNLTGALEQGQPAIVWADQASLPYYALPKELIKYISHIAVVYGFDATEKVVHMADCAPGPLTVTPAVLAAARAAITAQKNKIMTVAPFTLSETLMEATIAAIQVNCQRMLEPTIANFGLKALQKWAGLINNQKDKKGWPTVFKRGPHLYQALKSVFQYIETFGTGGGGFRDMYASFLEEASLLTNRPQLEVIAQQYRELGGQWSLFANAALPDNVSLFQETKELLVRRSRLFRDKGAAALAEMEQTDDRLVAIKAEVSVDFPLGDKEVNDLLAALSAQIRALFEAETRAIAQLQAAVV